jgi:hypothetical protein
MGITWKTAVFAFVGVGAVAPMGLNGNADDKGLLARSAEVPAVDCNIGDPLFPCFDPRWAIRRATCSFGTSTDFRRYRPVLRSMAEFGGSSLPRNAVEL